MNSKPTISRSIASSFLTRGLLLSILAFFAIGTAFSQPYCTTSQSVQTATAPTIDGVADAVWNNTVWETGFNNDGAASICNCPEPGFSAQWKTLWDNTNIYLFVSVTDAGALYFDTHGSDKWFFNYDAVEVYIDPTDAGGGAYTNHDAQIGFSPNTGGAANTADVYLGTHGASVTGTGVTYALVANPGTGYTMEIKIPWSSLGLGAPAMDATIGLGVAIDENHTDPDPDSHDDGGGVGTDNLNGGLYRNTQWQWNSAANDLWGDPNDFPKVALTAPPSAAVAGPDQNLCGVTTTTLAATTPTVFSTGGTAPNLTGWTIVSGAGGSFGNATSPTSTFSGVTGQTYKLMWTVANNPCTPITPINTDEVNITFEAPATLSLTSGSTAQTVCITNPIAAITYTIGGSATGATVTGLPAGVTSAFAGGVVTISGTPTAAGGPTTYTVTTTGGCGSASLTGTITVTAAATLSLTSGSAAQTICITTAIAPITYTIGGSATGATVTGLPAGVTSAFAGGVVTISGTPTAAGGPTTYTVTTTGGCGSASLTGTITVTAAATLTHTAGSTAQTICITSPIAAITYTIGGSATGATVTGLPAGVTSAFAGGVVTISGTPTAAGGPTTYTVTTTGGCGSVSLTGTITVTAAATLSLTSGSAAQTICITNPIGAITYTIGGSATGATVTGLPAGVTSAFAGGVVTISGTPTAAGGPTTYTVTTTGGCGSQSLTGTITVTAAATLSLTSGSAAQTICITTAIAPITYTIGGSATGATVTGLPAGVTSAFAGGVVTISGTPTAAGGPTTYTVTTTGGCGSVSLTGTITVTAAATLSLTSGSAAQTICITTAIAPITYTIGGSATGATVTGLPAGVTSSFAGGVVTISGTPTAAGGPTTYTVTTTGGCGAASLTGTITVTAAATLSLTSGSAAQTICITTAIAPITYTIGGSATGATVTGLPAGVTSAFAGGVVTISGTPTAAGGPTTYTVTTTGGCGSASLTGTITVTAAATLTHTAGSTAQTVCINTAIAAITYTVAGSGTGATVTGLPAGVTSGFAAGIVTISGTPTAAGGPTTYTVTTTGGCGSVSLTGTITVNPDATLSLTSGAAVQAVCVNSPIATIKYAVGGGGTGATVTGLPAGVTGTYAAGVVTISGTPSTTVGSPFGYTVTTTGTCAQQNLSGTLTVNPILSPTVSCGATTNTTTPFNWTAVAGAVNYTLSYTINAGAPVTPAATTLTTYTVAGLAPGDAVVLTVTPTGAGCFAAGTGTCSAVSCPVITTTVPANSTVCNNAAIPAATFVSTPGGATFAWTNNTPSIGLAAAGAGNTINTFTATNATASPVTASIIVTPTIGVCPGTPSTYTITVNPDATLALTSAGATTSQTVCVNTAITAITYSVGGGGTSATVTGLPAGVTGTYAAGVVTISGTPSTATGSPFNYTVTTTGTCAQKSLTGSITVNPDATLALTSAGATTTQTVCVNTAIAAITYSVGGGGTSATVTGLPPGVTGTYAAGVVTISGTPSTAVGSPFNYTVTTTGTCAQKSLTGSITVNPNATLALTSAGATTAQTVCVNTAITPITYAVGGSGTNATITGLPAGVTGTYAAGVVTISGSPSTTVGSPFNYTVTTTGGSCVEPSLTGSITVNPILSPTVSCGATTNTTTPFNWTAVAGAVNYTLSYTVNGGAAVTPAATTLTTYTVAGLAPGDAVVLTVTPTGAGCFAAGIGTCSAVSCPVITTTVPANSTVCNNAAIPAATFVSTPGGATFAWTNNTPSIGLAAAGVGNTINTFTATNATASPVTASIIVTPTIGVCPGTPSTYTITVNPDATLALTSAGATTTQAVCVNTAITPITYAVGGSGTNAMITGLPAGVTGTYAAGVVTISGTPTTTVGSPFNYTVTTTGGSCVEPSLTGTLTVNPILSPTVSCGATTNTTTPFNWTAVAGAVNYTLSYTINAGAPVTPAATTLTTYTVAGLAPGDAVVLTVTPTGAGCFAAGTGTCSAVSCPVITTTVPANSTVCNNAAIPAATFVSTPGGATFAWTNNTPSIGLAAAGVGNTINTFTATNATASPVTASIIVTPTIGVCPGTPSTYTITVNPDATLALTSAGATTSQTVCVNTAITAITYSVGGGGTSATVTGLPAGVTGTYAAGVVTISGTPSTAVGSPFNYIVTTTGTCAQKSLTGSITVNPDATLALTSAGATTTQTVCVNTAIAAITYSVGGGGTSATVTGLPPGVTGTYAAGVVTISGTPSTAVGSPFNYTVTTTGTCAQKSLTGSITVNPNATLALTSAGATTAQTVCVNTAITPITYAVGGSGTNATVTGLPAGVTGTYAAGVVTISGSPSTTVGSPFNYTVTTTGTCAQQSLTGSITVNPNATLALTSAGATTTQSVCINTPITAITYAVGGGGTSATVTGLPAGVTGTYAGGVVTISGSPTTTTGSPFNYTVTTTGTCVQQNLSGSITVNPDATLALTSGAASTAQSVCVNSPISAITYTVGGGGTSANVTGLPAGVTGTYAGGIVTISGTPTVTAGSPYAYTVTTTGTCAQQNLTGSITVNVTPTITVTPSNPTTCGGTDGSLTIGGLTTGAAYTVNFSQNGVAQAAQNLTAVAGAVTIANLTKGNYSNITVTTASGCLSTNSGAATLSDPAPPAAVASNNGPVCSGSTLDLNVTATVGATYAWTGPGGFTAAIPDPSIPNAQTNNSGLYNVTVTLANCPTPASTIATVNPTPVLQVTNPIPVCTPTTVDLTAPAVTAGSIFPAGTAFNYYTSPGASNPIPNPSAVAISGTDSIEAITGAGCADVQPVVVTINQTPLPPISGGNQSVCATPPLPTLTATATPAPGSPAGTDIMWYYSPTGGNLVPNNTPDLNLVSTIIYYAEADNPSGCNSTSRTPVTLIIGSPPTVTLADTALSIDLGNFVQLFGTAIVAPGDSVTALWNAIPTSSNADISNINSLDPVVNPTVSTYYTLTATSVNYGCSASATVHITVLRPILIPNVFSPNGDGMHDTWYIKNLEQYPNAEVDIFNRYGQFVFQVQGNYLEKPWDGTYNGQPVPVGEYYYIIKLNSGTEMDAKPIAGGVSIVR